MSYLTTLEIVRATGIGVEIVNETVGTGDNSEADFDLDNGNIIAGSYTLLHAATGSNNLTALTETTHYTLDKDAGTVLLTASGITALGTDILYAKYTYSPQMSDTLLNTFIAPTEAEVEQKTGYYWGAVKADTQFFDFDKRFDYPTTDAPYATDWDEPDELQLKKVKNLQLLKGVYELGGGASISEAYRYDSVGASYTSVKTEINSRSGDSFQPFADTTAANDYLYVGSAYKFLGLNIIMDVVGVTGSSNTIEYWNGSSWTAFTPSSGAIDFEADSAVRWTLPAGWAKTTVNSGSSLYFVRFVAGGTYSTEAQIATIYLDQDSLIIADIPLYNISASSDGRMIFNNYRIPNGRRKIRVDFSHGYASPPDLVANLAATLAGIRAYAVISGGSYDDATSYTLGRKQVSIGEVYVNVAEVVRQFERRAQELLMQIGPKMSVC